MEEGIKTTKIPEGIIEVTNIREEGNMVKEIAERLDGMQYGDRIPKDIEELAKENNIVIVYGYSDDLIELRGAIDDEIDAWGGGNVYIHNSKLMEVCDVDCIYYQEARAKARKVTGTFKSHWTFDSDFEYEAFTVYEDLELQCIGMVFKL